MAERLVVAPGRSLTPKLGPRLKPGAEIRVGEFFDKKTVEAYIRGGFVVVQSGILTPQDERARALAALDEVTTTVPLDGEGIEDGRTSADHDRSIEVTTKEEAGPASGEASQKVTHWNLDPDGIRNKSLEDLRVLIAERDPSITDEDVTTVEDAVALLSADFVAPVIAE